MENMNPLPIIPPHQPAVFRKEGTPFSKAIVSLTKQEYIQLKWDGRYWKRQHDRAVVRAAAFKQELELAQARIRDLSGDGRFRNRRNPSGRLCPQDQARALPQDLPMPGCAGRDRLLRPALI